MDTRQILLRGYNSKEETNTSESLNVQLQTRRKLLPNNDFLYNLNEYEQYEKERSACTKVRLTVQVNPICSNVLFNDVTEIVSGEGSPKVSVLNFNVYEGQVDGTKKINGTQLKENKELSFWNSQEGLEPSTTVTHPTNAIRDTQISALGWVYHCGRDIFNNHLVRSNTFKQVCDLHGTQSVSANTLYDILRYAIDPPKSRTYGCNVFAAECKRI